MSEKTKLNISGIIKGIAFSLIFTFILIFVIAAACYFFTVSDSLLSLLVMAAVGASVFIASMLVSKSTEKNGLLHGFLIAAGYMIIVIITGIIAKKGFSADMHLLTGILSALCFGALGGILGVNNAD